MYEGNIFSDGGNTYCPGCKKLLIRRSWHDVMENRLKKGKCPECGFAIAGVWVKREAARRANGNGGVGKRYEHLNL